MASVLIRNVDEALHRLLKRSAASHRRSLEEEARELLRGAIARQQTDRRENLADVAAELFGREHGVDLDLPRRGSGPLRPPLDFDDSDDGALNEP